MDQFKIGCNYCIAAVVGIGRTTVFLIEHQRVTQCMLARD